MKNLFELNPLLAWLGAINMLLAAVLLVYYFITDVEVLGINATLKPAKFAISLAIFSWTMALLLPHIASERQIYVYSLMVVLVMSYEQIVITVQALSGQQSHFSTTPVGSILFSLMGMAITVLTLWTLFFALQSFLVSYQETSPYVLQGIRWGIIIFALAGFLGFAMGAQQSHTVGGPDGGPGLPILNWSTHFGDLRVAHFFGLHALQLFPLAGYLVASSGLGQKALLLYTFMAFYAGYVCFAAVQAFLAKPFWS